MMHEITRLDSTAPTFMPTSSLASSRYPQAQRATWKGVINENLIKPRGTSPPQCPQRVKLPFTAPYITMFLSHFLTVTPCRAAPWPQTGVIISKTVAPPALRDYFNARPEFSYPISSLQFLARRSWFRGGKGRIWGLSWGGNIHSRVMGCCISQLQTF